ncbi:MAG: zinc ribbon domain-containing protein [Gemmatimonadota bacterium]|jgi:putative FmdB family regulatory protein
MPSYDFVCQDCGASFEVRLSMSAYSAGDGRDCPRCGSTQAERSYTTVNVIAGGRGDSWAGAGYAKGSCGTGGFT